MPLPKPKPNEKYKDFMSRALRDKEMKKKYSKIKQRFAVAVKQWNENKKGGK